MLGVRHRKPMKFYLRDGGVITFFDEGNLTGSLNVNNILEALNTEYRFYNQTPWSVLAHSYACHQAYTYLYGENYVGQLLMLTHDFAEAFVRDVPTVAKTQDQKHLEEEVQRQILDYFGLRQLPASLEYLPEHKNIDYHMLLPEVRHFYNPSDEIVSAITARHEINEEVAWACERGFDESMKISDHISVVGDLFDELCTIYMRESLNVDDV
jgi:5'-deoxynucleotidase YfbR-like HD superfamily hydrolase